MNDRRRPSRRLVLAALLLIGLIGGSALAAPHGGIIAIHADPGNASATNWHRLAQIVALADQPAFGHKLTLLLGVDWLDTLNDPSPVWMLGLVKSWIENGHQIGFHHHACGHGAYDGYNNAEKGSALIAVDPVYRDYVQGCALEPFTDYMPAAHDQLWQLATRLAGAGLVLTDVNGLNVAAQGSAGGAADSRQYEWDPGLIHATGSGSTGTSGQAYEQAIDPALCEDYGRYEPATDTVTPVPNVIKLPHYRLALAGNGGLDTQDVVDALNAAAADEYVGIVFHAKEFAPVDADGDGVLETVEVAKAFQAFKQAGVTARSVGMTVAEDGLNCP